MIKYLAAMAAAGSVVLGAGSARAGVFAESALFSANGVGGPNSPPLDESVGFSFNVYDLASWPNGPVDPPESTRRPVFDRLVIDEGDVGQTFYVPATEVPGAAALLTNGERNLVDLRVRLSNEQSTGQVSSGFVGTTLRPESPFLFNTVPGIPPRDTVDLAGYGLTEIGVKVKKLRLNDALPGNYDFAFTVVFVPEPSGVALLGLGGLVLTRRRRAGR